MKTFINREIGIEINWSKELWYNIITYKEDDLIAMWFEYINKTEITLTKPFAGYPIWYYILKWDYYINGQSWQLDDWYRYTVWHYRIHKDIVEGMKGHFYFL